MCQSPAGKAAQRVTGEPWPRQTARPFPALPLLGAQHGRAPQFLPWLLSQSLLSEPLEQGKATPQGTGTGVHKAMGVLGQASAAAGTLVGSQQTRICSRTPIRVQLGPEGAGNQPGSGASPPAAASPGQWGLPGELQGTRPAPTGWEWGWELRCEVESPTQPCSSCIPSHRTDPSRQRGAGRSPWQAGKCWKRLQA